LWLLLVPWRLFLPVALLVHLSLIDDIEGVLKLLFPVAFGCFITHYCNPVGSCDSSWCDFSARQPWFQIQGVDPR
jgi:hypothetical protein